jgi:ribonuclease VapC
MIAIDSSVYAAIVLGEPEAPLLSKAIASADERTMSAGNYLECAIVSHRRLGGSADLDLWLQERGISVISVDHTMARLAGEAFARFGKGRHPAGLNYGDCFAYALAKSLDAPLLYKGDDFAQTDIRPALL